MRLAIPAASLPLGLRTPIVLPVLLFALAVLLLAGIIHIATILLIPSYAVADGWSRLAAVAGENRFAEIRSDGPGTQAVPGLDPLFVHGACRIGIAQSPTALALKARERFWSLALYDPAGSVVFSLNDRTAVEGELDMLVVDPEENAQIKENPALGSTQTIVVESPSDDLVALIRLYAPTANSRSEARSVLAAARCVPSPFPAAEAPAS